MRLWSLPLLVLMALGVVARPGAAPDIHCSRTVGAGTPVTKVIAHARPGATICLRDGDYGPLQLSGVSKKPPVTVRSAPGEKAVIDGIDLTSPTGLRFVALRLTEGVSVSPSGSNISFLENNISGHRGIYIFGDYRLGKRVKNVRIEGNEIHDIDYSGTQETGYGYGIEGVGEVRRVVVRGNLITKTASDYVQSATPVNWVVDRNTFRGPSLLGSHEDHQDLWQIFGGGTDIAFTNNVARDTQTQESLLFQEGTFHDVVVENNLFDHDSRGYTCQILQAHGLVFRRNTVVDSRWGCLFRDLPAPAGSNQPGSGYHVDHNIFVGTEEGPDLGFEGRAASFGTYAYNVSGDGSANGPHSIRHWSPKWENPRTFAPRGLPFPAGYHVPR